MSGGYFDKEEYRIKTIISQVEELIEEQQSPDCCCKYTDKTVAIFKAVIPDLRRSLIMLHEIDLLVSGDTVEGSFHERLACISRQ